MPRKDPITGVPVMTIGEFWNMEAAREGVPAGDLMERHFQEWDESLEQERQRLMTPEHALSTVLPLIASWDVDVDEDDRIEPPVRILEVLEADYKQSFRQSSQKIRARAERADGSEGVFSFSHRNYSGSFSEPPDWEVEAFWEDQNCMEESNVR
jgi:hypothetical protein